MTQTRTHRPVRILIIGLDRRTTKAIRSDFPRGKVTATRTFYTYARDSRVSAPDLVVMGSAQPDAAEQRDAIWRRWGDAIVVAEIHGQQPLARVWRTPRMVERVELGPGFLWPFVTRYTVNQIRSAAPLMSLRMLGYLVALWNLTIGVHVLGLPPSGVGITIIAFVVLVGSLLYSSWHDRQSGQVRGFTG
jgi:hypothetical protein